MAETLLYQGVAVNPANGSRLRLGHNVETLAGAKTLTPQDAQFQALDPDGEARDVILPAEEVSQGLWFVIKNTAGGAENLVIEDDGGSGVLTIANLECTMVVCDGSSWISLGVVIFAVS